VNLDTFERNGFCRRLSTSGYHDGLQALINQGFGQIIRSKRSALPWSIEMLMKDKDFHPANKRIVSGHHEPTNKILRALRVFSLRFSAITTFEVLQKMCAV
jgi:hypothetical protein